MKKNNYFLALIGVFLVAIIVRFGIVYKQNTLQSLKLTTETGLVLNNSMLANNRTVFILVNRMNALTRSIIEYIISAKENADNLVIYDTQSSISSNKENIYFIRASPPGYIFGLFNIEDNLNNYIIIFAKRQDLLLKATINGNHSEKIRSYFIKPLKQEDLEDKINVACLLLKNVIRDYKNGHYYLTDQLLSSCLCFNIYQDYEDICFVTKNNLKLLLLGQWTDTDIQNLIEERSQRVIAERAKQNIIDIFDDIRSDFPEFHINIIIEKNENNLFVFPLINTNISSIWETLRNKIGRVS